MKQRRNIVITLFCVLTVVAVVTIISLVLAHKNTSTTENEIAFLPIPFGGYVCAYENTETFLQLPLLFNSEKELSAEDISNITLISNKAELSCNSYSLTLYRHNEECNYKLSTLKFIVKLPRSGEYTVDQIRFTMHDGTIINKKLGKIVFNVKKAENSNAEISMRQFMINQEDYKIFRIAYQNNTDKTVKLAGLVYPESIYKGQTIRKYRDFDITIQEDGLDIPAGEERTFLFSLDPKSDYFKDDHNFLFMLPFVRYSVDGSTKTMPSQTQATVIQSPFTPDYVIQLFEDNGLQ